MKIKFLDGTEKEIENLRGADLRGANLSYSNLSGANLSGAYLYGAYLRHADLSRADLYGAYLHGADLRHAHLSGANLSGAHLRHANLSGAYLSHADLSGAYLSGAYLYGADLSGAKSDETTELPAFQIPQSGPLFVWKKVNPDFLAYLRIPAQTPRTASVVGRKCRAAQARVIALYDLDGTRAPAKRRASSIHDCDTKYEVGAMVKADKYDPNPLVECTHGIHFFLTREEAEAY